MLKHFPVEVLNGKDYLEVRPAGVNKGVMLERIYKRLQATDTKTSKSKSKKTAAQKKPVDFMVCIGDDDSDEKMFNVLNSIESSESNKHLKAYTVTVGKKPSEVRILSPWPCYSRMHALTLAHFRAAVRAFTPAHTLCRPKTM